MAAATAEDTLREVSKEVKQYTFTPEPIPRLSCTDPKAEKLIANEVSAVSFKLD